MSEVWHGLVRDRATDAEIATEQATYEPFTEAVRELVDLATRTDVDLDVVEAARRDVEAISARLRTTTMPTSYGVRLGETTWRDWGNAAAGLRNPVAPPLVVRRDDAGRVRGEVTLGAAYEGPSGLAHGGVSALLLDQVLGMAASHGDSVRMTGSLSLRYRRPVRLGVPLVAEARVERVEGVKAYAVAHLADADGPCVEAEAVFVTPRWARRENETEEQR